VQVYNQTAGQTQQTGYSLRVNRSEAPFLGMIGGRVIDSLTRQGIDGARIRTNGGYSAISTHGEYEMMHQAGDYTMYAEADGYKSSASLYVSVHEGEVLSKDMYLTPKATTSSTTTTSVRDGGSTQGGTRSTTTIEPPLPDTSTTTTIDDGSQSSTTSTTAASSTTTTAPANQCPLETLLGAGHPGLDVFRHFRDTQLASTNAGQQLIKLYYAHGKELTAALQRSPSFRSWARQMALDLLPLIEAAMELGVRGDA